jgi:hypothetical protein
MLLNGLLVDAVRTHVADPNAIRRVAEAWQWACVGAGLAPAGFDA